MKILYDLELTSTLSNSFLFLDNTVFITALNYEKEFGGLLKELKLKGCAMLTIPSVFFEFTRGSDNIETYNKRAEFLDSIANIYPIEKNIEEIQDFIIAYQKLAGNVSYTDFLLASCLYKFPGAYLLTENHRDFAGTIFKREHIITLYDDKEIRSHGVYSLAEERLQKVAEKMLKFPNLKKAFTKEA